MEHRPTASIESDIATIQKFASSYRAYWGVTSDGAEREPVRDRIGLRHRLHRQLPAVEKVMARANTNGFGFKPPPIARGAPPRIGIVAVAFADEDPLYSVGGGPSCFEEVLNRLEMTLGVLDAELSEAKSAPPSAQRQTPGSDRDLDPVPEGNDAAVGEAGVQVQEVDRLRPGTGAVRTFLQGMKAALRDARAARRGGIRGAIERGVAVVAGIATIIGVLGAMFGWWNP